MSTIKDVAKQSGFSVATVSRCLNNSGYVGEDTRNIIIKVANELNYIPMLSAQILRTNRSNLIALVILTLRNSYFVELAEYIDQECLNNGYKLILCNINEDIDREKSYIELIKNMNLDGVIIAGGERTYSQLSHIPVVLVDRMNVEGHNLSTVTTNNYKGAKLLTEHLINTGCNHILFVEPFNSNYASDIRKAAFLDCVKGKAIKYSELKYNSLQDIENVNFREFDGIFAWNDEVAIDLLFHMQRNKINVPNDVKIVGYDNNYLSQRIVPSLTTIEQSYDDLAKKSVELLIKKIDDIDDTTDIIQIEPKLIIRESTGGIDE